MGIIQTMMNRKYQLEDREARSAGIKDLVGEKGWEQVGAPQPNANGIMERLSTIGGSGLMGGEGYTNPENRANFAAGLMQLPGMEAAGSGLLGQQFGQQNAQNMAMIKNVMEQAKANRWTSKDVLTNTTQQKTAFDKANAPIRVQLQEFNNAGNMVKQAGGYGAMNPTQDLAMITSLAKMLKPNEAVMADDVENVLRTSGFLEYGDLAKNLISGGQLTEVQRRDIYDVMQQRAEQAQQQGQDLRTMTSERLAPTPLQNNQVMQPMMQYAPVQSDRRVAPEGQVDRGAPEGQIDRGGVPGERAIGTPGVLNAIPPGVLFEYEASPTGWATYNDAGDIIEAPANNIGR